MKFHNNVTIKFFEEYFVAVKYSRTQLLKVFQMITNHTVVQ